MPHDRNATQTNEHSGTELRISGLRHIWTTDDIRRLYEELSTLTPPFDAPDDFSIFLVNDVAPEYDGLVESSVVEGATVELQAHFDGKSTIKYNVKTRGAVGSRDYQLKISWANLVTRASSKASPSSLEPDFGAAEVRLLFFLRKPEAIADANISLTDLREFLNRNAGVRIYRDKMRVKPYGNLADLGGDWLGLGERKARDPAGAGRKSFKVGPNQLVGAVFIGKKENPRLSDSAAREGLHENRQFFELRALVLGCVSLLESSYHEAFDEKKFEEGGKSSAEAAQLEENLAVLSKSLARTVKHLQSLDDEVAKQAVIQLSATAERVKGVREVVERLASQATVYRGLATTGIAATVFGHETQASIGQVSASLSAALTLLEVDATSANDIKEELETAKAHAEKVALWGTFALSRVRRDKRRRRKIDLTELVDGLIREIKPIFDSAGIEILKDLKKAQGKVFAMDVESILVNLLTNAYDACQRENRKRIVLIQVEPAKKDGQPGFELSVSDSGPGVADQFKNRIWEPLFSTKTDTSGKQIGTGLGLSIIQSVVDELHGSRNVGIDPKLKGARFSVWLPF